MPWGQCYRVFKPREVRIKLGRNASEQLAYLNCHAVG